MVACPECKRNIEHLICVQDIETTHRYKFYPNTENTNPEYRECEEDEGCVVDAPYFVCPECEAVITDDESKAIDFLNGESYC